MPITIMEFVYVCVYLMKHWSIYHKNKTMDINWFCGKEGEHLFPEGKLKQLTYKFLTEKMLRKLLSSRLKKHLFVHH